jgi:hypothetical protein
MIIEDDAPPCDRCGAQTAFVLQLHPSGAASGARIYYCQTCKRHTWQDLRRPPSWSPSSPAVPQQTAQRQQQQQTQSKKDEPEG